MGQVEAGLAGEIELLRLLADKVPSILCYWDASLRCRLCNRAYERWFGVKPDAVLGRRIEEVLGPHYASSRPHIEAALRGETQEFEREMPDPNGGPPRRSLVDYIPHVVDGEVKGFFGLLTDITRIKDAEVALRESEERFRLTVDEAPIGMALVAADGRFVRVNRALCDIVGYTAEELTGRTFQSITHPDDLDIDLELAGRLARGEIPRYVLEKRYIRKGGRLVDVLLSASVLRDVHGHVATFIAQIQDISAQKRLARARDLLVKLGPIMGDTLDFEGTLSRVAECAVEALADICIVDLVEDDVVRRLKVACRDPEKEWICRRLKAVNVAEGRWHLLAKVLQRREAMLMTWTDLEDLRGLLLDEDHERALRAANIVSVIGVPLIAHGRLVGAIALVSTSPEKVYDDDDLRLAEELARRAALSIQNARLYLDALRATRARDEVLAVVAHDLRLPLQAILLQASLLRSTWGTGAPPRAPHPADVIERSARRMKRLIEDLLDVTRLEAGCLTLTTRRLPAAPLLELATDAAKHAAAGSHEILQEQPVALPAVTADSDRVLQVFENLVSNALKFTPKHGRIVLGAKATENEVTFYVTDNGSGVSESQMSHLFDRFWQAPGGERRGAGLGLTIVKGIVEAHGGRIWAESKPGVGSSFYFTLPREDAERSRRTPASRWSLA